MQPSVSTGIEGFTLKKAVEADAPVIHYFIEQIAIYEKLLHQVTSTPQDVARVFFCENPRVFCYLAYYNNEPVGFMVYFFNFSTFLCKHGIYLEDLFVLPDYRGKGFGKVMLSYLAGIAVAENCGRMEWSVLDWNTPSIEFYKSLNAVAMDEWTTFRLQEEDIRALAARF